MTDDLEQRVEELEQKVEKQTENQLKLVKVVENLNESVEDISSSMIAKQYVKAMASGQFEEFREEHPEEAEDLEEIALNFIKSKE